MLEISPFKHPDWSPKVQSGSRILIAGASGGLGTALVDMLIDHSDCIVGAHGAPKPPAKTYHKNVIGFQQSLSSEADCIALVDGFVEKAGGIDGIVLLNGALNHSGNWREMPEDAWNADMATNLGHPFFLARHAMAIMRDAGDGGRIVFNGTESALHGGSSHSMPYAMTKLATECMVKGMARDGAPDGILVNGVRLGFIVSGFHQRWSGRDDTFLQERSELVPLKRGGDPAEVAALICYLLSGWSSFITGQMFALTGGDWL